METILNNPQTSFLKEPKVFHEIHAQSKMPMSSMIKSIGQGAKKQREKKPTDDERAEARLSEMKSKTEKE